MTLKLVLQITLLIILAVVMQTRKRQPGGLTPRWLALFSLAAAGILAAIVLTILGL